MTVPFWLRRPSLIAKGLLANRERPNLDALRAITDPEQFIWAILPHAARTFAAGIAFLPARAALPAAVAYLYCRMLDTYEDLVVDREERERSLRQFAERLTEPGIADAPRIETPADRDDRDRVHLLLVERAGLVDAVFTSFDAETRAVIVDLVREMSAGMRWSSSTFAKHGGTLMTPEELETYCHHVLANPVIFTVSLVRLGGGAPGRLSEQELTDARHVGEMVQLANVTRDIEKDLGRGVAYEPSLRPYLGRDVRKDADAMARVQVVRGQLMQMALRRAPSYARMVRSMRLPRLSIARASAVVMLLFTERYFRSCARRAGLPAWGGSDSTGSILLRAMLAAVSPAQAFRQIARVERRFLAAAGEAAHS